MNKNVSSESVVKDIRRRTRKKYSLEAKIRIALEPFQSQMSAFGRLETFDFKLGNYRKFPRIDLFFIFLHNRHSLELFNLKDIHVLFETVHTHT